MCVDLNKLSTGISNFEDLILKNKIYVDKTKVIYQLSQNSDRPLLFTRPRRFGKSLLVSTFEYLFKQQLDLFKSLAIYKSWQDTNSYKVIRLDFSLTKAENEKLFSLKFKELLRRQFEKLNIQVSEPLSGLPEDYFLNFVDKCKAGEIVLLVDEYDAPLTYLMENKTEFEAVRNRLSCFYDTVKSYQNKFRFLFITGVTRYKNTSIFSAFNNLQDISTSYEYGALLGYTKEEIDTYFKPYIANAASRLNCTQEDVYDNLKNYYDHYCFEKTASVHVYNTWSILNFFANVGNGNAFESYWGDTGGFSTLVANFMAKQNKFEELKACSVELLQKFSCEDDNLIELDFDTLNMASNPMDMDTRVLMFQAGYLSIKRQLGGIGYFGIPNLEIKKLLNKIFFNKVYLPSLTEDIRSVYQDNITKLSIVKACIEHSLEKFVDYFNLIANTTSYQANFFDNECTIRDLIYMIVLDKGFDCSIEKTSAKGRSDLELIYNQDRFVFEFKVAKSDSEIESKLNQAIEQIKSKDYGMTLPFKNTYRYALVFSKTQRQIVASRQLDKA